MPAQFFNGRLRYVVRFLPASVDPEEFAEMISENVAPDAEETMRTLRDVWIQEGLVKGKAEGKAEGKVEGEADATLRVLQVRFGPAAESLRSRIEAIRDSGSLLRLIGFAATAESLEAFARELRDG